MSGSGRLDSNYCSDEAAAAAVGVGGLLDVGAAGGATSPLGVLLPSLSASLVTVSAAVLHSTLNN